MPYLSDKEAAGYASFVNRIESKGATVSMFLRHLKEGKRKGLRGSAVFYYASARLGGPESTSFRDALVVQELEDKYGVEGATKIIDEGLRLTKVAMDLGVDKKQIERAVKDGAALVRMAQHHGLDPSVWRGIIDEVTSEGLTGRAAGDAMVEKFWALVDRSAWPKKDDEES